jgi:hypothetical protein
MTFQSTSTTNLRPSSSSGGYIDFDENSYSLSRRKRLSASILIPPPIPRSRPIIPHSKSLTTIRQPSIGLTSHKICTEV